MCNKQTPAEESSTTVRFSALCCCCYPMLPDLWRRIWSKEIWFLNTKRRRKKVESSSSTLILDQKKKLAFSHIKTCSFSLPFQASNAALWKVDTGNNTPSWLIHFDLMIYIFLFPRSASSRAMNELDFGCHIASLTANKSTVTTPRRDFSNVANNRCWHYKKRVQVQGIHRDLIVNELLFVFRLHINNYDSKERF